MFSKERRREPSASRAPRNLFPLSWIFRGFGLGNSVKNNTAELVCICTNEIALSRFARVRQSIGLHQKIYMDETVRSYCSVPVGDTINTLLCT